MWNDVPGSARHRLISIVEARGNRSRDVAVDHVLPERNVGDPVILVPLENEAATHRSPMFG
ncbi:hypothetical protein AAVH_27568 [Aphelenchoides avenae]|nr:hypothetical protein AAVH_27568 [Aphelenchus avenae]